ncbi:unnamed protein product [Meloidogyne enterolobii]|uniref:Uncharacterized protein n=1 Tax=Meloidogyne enterolobii TaxID=390850 RepID=A0ACB0ZB50_MELEN
MSSVAQTSKKRLVPVSAESSPHLNSQHHVQRQHNSSSSSSNSTTPQQRTPPSHPYCPVQPSFSSPSSTSILQQQNEHQQHSNKNKNNDGSYLMHSAPISQQQHSTINTQNQTLASAGAAENSPLLVNLLNNNASSPAIQQTQKPQQILQQNVTPLPQQQQMMMIKQQQQMAALQQQHPNAMGQAQQVNSHQYGVPMNPQQHQQMYQQQQQRLAQQQSMMYSVGPSGVINNTPQQHYMIVGSPPTGSSPSQYHRQATHYGANGQPAPGGIVASPPGAPSPYFGMPTNYVPQQMIIPTTGADKQGSSGQMFSIGPPINNTQLTVEELPKKRKRISKKQQQKEEREREQRLRLQEQQQQAAMAAFRQHQQMAFMQQQQQQQRMAAVNAGIPQQMCGGMVMPSNMQNCQVPPGQVIAAQQHYQQQQQTYQQHYLGLPGQPAIQKQDTNVIQNNMSPSICPYGTPQKGSPMQPTGAPMSQQQQYVVALQQQQHGQQTLQNQCYVSPQQQAPWANTPNQMSQCGMQQQQNALNDYQSTAAITNQSHCQQQNPQQLVQSQQAFRTPGTPHYFSQSPASATPFYSPPPSHNQQMVGTPIGNGSGGGTCGGMQGSGPGHLTPVSATAGGPTPPHSAGSFGNPQHQHSSTPVLDTNVEPPKQQNTIDQTISSQNRHLMQQQQQMMAHMQQSSPHANHVEFYQQRFQHQRQSMENITQQTHQNSLQQQPRNFSQLSDFAESGFGDANDLNVPGILGEGIDDLDSIEPMRYGGEHQNHNNLDQRQQQQLVLQQSDDSNQQQNLSNNFYRSQPLVQQQGQQQQPKQVVKRQLLNSDQCGQQCKKQKRKYSVHQLQNGVEDERKEMLEMTIEQRNVAEMALLPDRSPQIGDTPLSPSKLSETQDRNVSDAIATVMERVAKNGPGQNFSSKASNF